MAKKSKLATPEWILEGYDSPEEYAKAKGKNEKKKPGKTYKVRRCPKCNSDKVKVVLGKEGDKSVGEWECAQCGWSGANVKIDELDEDEFMKYLDDKGEECC